MTTVADLRVGDVVALPGYPRSGTFLGRSDHPRYPGLQAVVWSMSDGDWSIDALSPLQDVGDVVARLSISDLAGALPAARLAHVP